ncbi:MAG TPA: PQQ-binding-like beta-propeller repeat protein [Pirellulaceae bacterium]|nr:PQQ-binding-like beta-propeller repeat protein [Pirellulaceae bacterium]
MRCHLSRLALSAAVVFAITASTCGHPLAEWPQFLGPSRNGNSADMGLLEKWPAGGPKELWRVAGGIGMSGLAIKDGKLLTLVQRDGQQWVVAHDAKTGAAQWQTPVASEYENQMGNGPRATPAIAGDRAFVFTGEGILAAVALADGRLLWSHNVLKELKGKEADYGMASSPLVVGDAVIVIAGAPNATIAAYNVQSGKLAWIAGDDPAGYSSPALLKLGGKEQIVAYTGAAAIGLSPQGALLWRYPYETDFNCNIATPLAVDGKVFLSSGENHGSVLLSLESDGEEFAAAEIWASQGPQSVLRNEWQTSILRDGHLYGFDNVGSAGPVTHLTCIEAATGKRVWQQTRFGKGNLIAADGKLFISTMKGELVVVRATPDKYDELGRATVIGSTRQAPSLAGGLLYLRDDKEIVCLDVRK